MKGLLFLLIVGLVVGCDSEKKKLEKQKMAMKAAIEDASKTVQTIDTICLGFRFGMTPEEVNIHCAELLDSSKIYLEDNYCIYDFHLTNNLAELKDGIVKTTFDADYYNNELYRFYLYFNIKKTLPENRQEQTFYDVARMNIADVLMSIYSSENMFYIGQAAPFVSIKGNLVVELKQDSKTTACATFTNMPVAKKADADKEKVGGAVEEL